MSCLPTYEYVPNTSPSNQTKNVPSYAKTRGRLTVLDPNPPSPPGGDSGGSVPDSVSPGWFFRSLDQSFSVNDIKISMSGNTITISNDIKVETFNVTLQNIMSQVNSQSSLVEMTVLGYDILDLGRDSVPTRLFEFDPQNLSGGDGPPESDPPSNGIDTGPTRSLVIIQSAEDPMGNIVDADPSERSLQWEGVEWISYCNYDQGNCPLDGTC